MSIYTNLRLGLEIEAAFDERIKPVLVGGYHAGERFGNYWTAERDGSLHASDMHRSTAEFVSKVLTLDVLPVALKEFESLMSTRGLIYSSMSIDEANFSRLSEYELNEVIDFNNSTGCHIHFSLENDPALRTKILQDHEPVLFGIVVNRMKARGIRPDLISTFVDAYYRDYARSISISRGRQDKYNSINFSSRLNTVEWRSFNLRGVKTWSEFQDMITIGVESVLEFVDSLTSRGFAYEEDVSFEIPERVSEDYAAVTVMPVMRRDGTKSRERRVLLSGSETARWQLDVPEEELEE